jgi:ATP-binding cassette subfamily B protein
MPDSLSILSAKLRFSLAQLAYLPRALGLVWAAARGWAAAWAVLLLAQGLLPVATVYLTRLLVDDLVAAAGEGGAWPVLAPLLLLVLLLAGVMLLSEVLRSAAGWVRTAQGELVKDHISALIHEKSTAADLAFYESPEYHDHLHRARDEAGYRPVALVEGLGQLLQNGVTLLAMGAVLLPFGWWLPLALLASTLPAFGVVLRYNLEQHHWRNRTTADERRSWYYDWLLTSGDTAAELRLFELGPLFQSLYQAIRARLRGERLQLARKGAVAELAAGTVALLVTGGAMVWMVRQALLGLVTLGGLALFYQAFQQGQRLMRSLLDGVGQVYTNSLFLGNLFDFLALRPRVTDPPDPVAAPLTLHRGIRFEGVTFRYPGSERVALNDFNLTIPAGQVAALVGPNGAGKSTLIKLLCRLYDPDAGRIELDGLDLRHLEVAKLRRLITVLFQQPVHYSATVAENIALGSLTEASRADVEAAAAASGADEPVARLPAGYDTLLGKWFAGGTELSVGEWQRLALARAFLRPAPILLLDEPTSAMDSWAEADWHERFRRLAAGRTVLIITHRFTTAMRADVIHVMAEGRISESGSHDELLARGGLYAESWAAQMRGESGSVPVNPGR